MAEHEVTVFARIKAGEDTRLEVLDMMQALIEPTRAEEGCIEYVLHESTEEDGLFMFYEKWRSLKDLHLHLDKPYLKDFVERSQPLLAEPVVVSTWRQVG